MRRLLLAAALASLTAPATAATLVSFYKSPSVQLNTLALADAAVAAGPPVATFTSTGIDYPAGSINTNNSSNTTLSAFLGVDAPSLSGGQNVDLQDSVFVFEGFLDLAPGVDTLVVGSDDGFRLTVDGNVLGSTGTRGFTETTFFQELGTGVVPFTLLYFERGGNAGVEFSQDGNIVVGVAGPPAAIPLPPAALLLGTALAGLAVLRRRT
ncbi:MAG: hypothetical protein AAGI34_03800 [Pseudomonadota bacterium]